MSQNILQMAVDTFRNVRPLFRVRVDLPRVRMVNKRRLVLYLSAEIRAGKIGVMFSKGIYFPSMFAVKEMVYGRRKHSDQHA